MNDGLREIASILRLHIIGVAVVGALVFGLLITGTYRFDLAVLAGADWLLINLLNRVTDLKEDLANDIRGSERVSHHLRTFVLVFSGLFASSFVISAIWWPELTWTRIIVQVIGVGYSVAIIPTPMGLRRFKDIYFLKNFMSAVLFILTLFVYPWQANGWEVVLEGGVEALFLLMVFFVSFELTYEILYDMRDLEGDRLAAVPTYPVVHGPHRARQIIDGLLLLSASVLLGGVFWGVVGVKEGLMLAAVVIQRLFYLPRYRRGLTREDCILVTHLGTALLLVYLVGTWAWAQAGLPENIYLNL